MFKKAFPRSHFDDAWRYAHTVEVPIVMVQAHSMELPSNLYLKA